VSEAGLPIGQVARRAGVHLQTVRYYERRGLLAPPARRPSGQRVYEPGVVDLLRIIKQAQRVGFTLAEIEELLRLSTGQAGRVDALGQRVRAKIAEIDARIRDLQEMRAALQATLHAGCDALTRCNDEGCPFWAAPGAAPRSTPGRPRRGGD
jgi:DNA-binding transcriptional MerR regulator